MTAKILPSLLLSDEERAGAQAAGGAGAGRFLLQLSTLNSMKELRTK